MSAEMLLGVVVGGTIATPYQRTMRGAGDAVKALGERWETTNKKLGAAGEVVHYRRQLERLRAKQVGATTSSARLDRGVPPRSRG